MRRRPRMSLFDPMQFLVSLDFSRLLDRCYGFDFQQEFWARQLRRADRFTFRRRWAEVARQQFSVFVELGRRRNEADRGGNVVDRRATSLKTGADVLANLLYLS